MSESHIRIRGARQNTLQGLDLDLPIGELIVVTGVSGSGKSSLAFDTVYAEGQRRYVETFSPYARQFLDRMDRPATDRVEGIPAAIAIDQVNPVRTSRSTVGTMTELNDHLKLLFSRMASLYCTSCGAPVRREDPESVASSLLAEHADEAVLITARVTIARGLDAATLRQLLQRQGYDRIHAEDDTALEVLVSRLRLRRQNRDRLVEALEQAFRLGQDRLYVHRLDADRAVIDSRGWSRALHCSACDQHYQDPVSGLFSFNSPVGACPDCRGFGRIMGIDPDLVIPNPRLSLADGAIRPWQTGKSAECQHDLLTAADAAGVAVDIAWQDLPDEHRRWVMDGDGKRWYGVRGYFDWLESKSYRMHVRVLLSKYRSYSVCPSCDGARLRSEALAWRVGSRHDADAVLPPAQRFQPVGSQLSAAAVAEQPGLCLHDVMRLPLQRCQQFFADLQLESGLDEAAGQLLETICLRLDYLVEVGLGYLTLDRQSRTLSGGEVQRINLTTALGTALVSTLFVLDEPSIGLHPRDMQRIIRVLQRLRDAGNTLLVVEHDAEVMLAADRIIDMGPGPGADGGQVVFNGAPAQLLSDADSLTGAFLSGRRRVLDTWRPSPEPTGMLRVRGACANNLANITIEIPLGQLVLLTGVSGSGKSTLMHDVLHRGILQAWGRPTDTAGAHQAIDGLSAIDDVVLVDQSAIGKSTRSNPASHVGAFDAIRKAFAALPDAVSRGYTAGTFSFNSGNGRCPACGGNGFEHVEMQFLSDVYLRCPDCDGKRYRADILDCRLPPAPGLASPPLSIADILELTVDQALAFFADQPDITRRLRPLCAVGLGYMRLGQPVPTLSGGESQRLKLAGHLAKASTGKRRDGHLLFLFDEPTTGLHFADVAVLLGAFRELLDAGHSLMVIEHNLDVIRAGDWLIELGPEGGDGGGQLVASGPPGVVAEQTDTHTARALRAAEHATRPTQAAALADASAGYRATHLPQIAIRQAREHNLQAIDVDIPHDQLTVITGLSGSGKSTLAFGILFNEGQRRYLESLNAYARQFVQPASKPDVDAISGIPPTVAIEQRTSRGGRKSTVGTLTEIHHFLRLLFVKLGVQHCPDCQVPIDAQDPDTITARILGTFAGESVTLLAPLVVARKGYYTDLANWAAGKGYRFLRVDGVMQPTDDWPRLDRYREHDIDLPVGEVDVEPANERQLRALLGEALAHGHDSLRVQAGDGREALFSASRSCPSCQRSFDAPDPRLFSYNSRQGWCPSCFGTGQRISGFDAEQSGEESAWQQADGGNCPRCDGQRLNPVARACRFHDASIADVSALSVAAARDWFAALELDARAAQIARDPLAEILHRLAFLDQLGLGYLALDRSAPTLSGGEAQRIRLAAQLGSNLQGVCYVLDEPTIGLHPRDNRMLLDALGRLRGKGNTIVVVEHDEDTIRSADHIIDLGPGAGVQGGRVVAAGNLQSLLEHPDSITGRSLATPMVHPLRGERRGCADAAWLELDGASLHNLRSVDLRLPLGRLIGVAGVSGSGKSTLIRSVLEPALRGLLDSRRQRQRPRPEHCRGVRGWESLTRVLEVDQAPIGKTPRSCPATYVGFWDAIRQLYAQTEEARIRGYGPGRFSFNTRDGRCPVCDGQGVRRIEMNFLPDVTVPCERCNGLRFTTETLSVTYRGRSVGDLLNMPIDEAVTFFEAHPAIHHPLRLLRDVGLGYLTLGQPSPTLSGGEAQRIKLVTELAKARPAGGRGSTQHTLYLLDEPTVGLHLFDVERLLRVLHQLVDAGNTVLVIEHNLDLLADVDWLLELGPEGGDQGGQIVAVGTPESVCAGSRSLTAPLLREHLAKR